jgi:hypothetical protein
MSDSNETTAFEQALAGFCLGESDTALRLASLEDFTRADQTLIAQARRKLFILTYDFEPARYNNDALASAISAFVRLSRFSDVRILLGDPAIAIRWGHRLVTLSRRLPSQLQIRQLSDDDFLQFQRQPELWIVADDIGLIRRDNKDVYRGMLAAKAIPAAQRASQQFLEMWERGKTINDFKRLDI